MSLKSPGKILGFTLLEVLIALSIFTLIGVASFQVLTRVMSNQTVGDEYSERLATLQKALMVVDRDLQQFVDRPIRLGDDQQLPSLMVASGDFPLELTRGGWRNPLQLSRSSLLRVAYDIGRHPQAEQEGSPFYGDERLYLRRLFWSALDRTADSQPFIQPVLPDVEAIQVAVVTERGKLTLWPPLKTDSGSIPEPRALEFTVIGQQFGAVSRIYKIESYQP